MSQREIGARIRGIIVEWNEYFHYRWQPYAMSDEMLRRSIRPSSEFDATCCDWIHYPRRDRFFTETYDNKNRLEIFQARLDCSNWIQQAEQLMQGRLELLGRKAVIPFRGGWLKDPVTHDDWPHSFYAQILASRKNSGRDIKYIWEINRHQYLIVLGKAYWLTGDERYVERVVSAIRSWIDENPMYMGVNWTSSLELAVRIISWVWTLFLCRDSGLLTPAFNKALVKSIYQQAVYIEDHLSFYSSPYNHLIGEAAALHMIGSLFPMFRSASRWEKKGWSILVNTVNDQFHEDGMSVEQASFYHHFTLGFYLQALYLRRHNDKPIPDNVLSRVEKALAFSLHLAKPDGTVPMIGDVDNARSIYFGPAHRWDFGAFLALGAVLYQRPDFKQRSAGWCEELLWYADDEDLKTFEDLESANPPATSVAFYKSGYVILRDNWQADANYLCFDCGDIAAGLSEAAVPSAAHGHADALSFELVVRGQSIIVDGGFYTYFGDLPWHTYFRHEEAHNTVSMDGCRQADYCGRLTWQKVKRPRLIQFQTTDDYDAVGGWVSFGESALHARQIIYAKRHFWLIRDFLHTNRPRQTVKSFLHFAPQVDLRMDEKLNALIATTHDVGLLIKFLGKHEVQWTRGGPDPSAGWVAHGYGIKLPSWRVQFSWKPSEHTTAVALLLIPFTAGRDSLHIADCASRSTAMNQIEFLNDGINCRVELKDKSSHFQVGSNEFRTEFPVPQQ